MSPRFCIGICLRGLIVKVNQESKSKNKILIVLVVILGIIVVILVGILIANSLDSSGSSEETTVPGAAEPVNPPVNNPPATGPVTIESFTLTPDRISVGDCVTLSWIIKNAEVVTLSKDGTQIYNGKIVDNYQDCPSQAGVYRYRLDASNSNGQYFNWSELQVIVQ